MTSVLYLLEYMASQWWVWLGLIVAFSIAPIAYWWVDR